MKSKLISVDMAAAAIVKLMRGAADSHEAEILDNVICAVMDLPGMIPETECAPEARWIMRRDEGQGVTWWECSTCSTIGSPGWKRCPACEAKMQLDPNAGGGRRR